MGVPANSRRTFRIAKSKIAFRNVKRERQRSWTLGGLSSSPQTLLVVVRDGVVRRFVAARVHVLIIVPAAHFVRCRTVRNLHAHCVVHHSLSSAYVKCEHIVCARRIELAGIPLEDYPLV